MKFWDSSALVPLVTPEPQSPPCHALMQSDPRMAVWALTPVEILSALSRKRREGSSDADTSARAKRILADLEATWNHVDSWIVVGARARRLLDVHDLRAADALQLAAALVFFNEQTAHAEFVSLDMRLRDAAAREGFSVLPVTS